MEQFVYRAYEKSGRAIRGEIDAATKEAAHAALRARGLIPFFAEPKTAAKTGGFLDQAIRGRKLSRKDVALFYREIAVLLDADLRLEEAIAVVAEQMRNPAHKEIVGGLLEKIRRGEKMSASLRAYPHSFDQFEAALFQSGESRGDLAGAARMAADILERSLAARDRLASAMIYPAILAVTALGAILVVSVVLAPAISPMFNRNGVAPPMAFSALLAFSTVVRNWWWAIIAALILLALLFRRALKNPSVAVKVEQLMFNTPLAGSIASNMETARLCRALASLLRAGATLNAALSDAGEICKTRLFRNWAIEANDLIRRGGRLSIAFADLAKAPAVAQRFIEIGERSGRLDKMLEHAADHADASAARTTNALMTALSPALTLIMGLVVGGLIAVVLTTILSANELVFGN